MHLRTVIFVAGVCIGIVAGYNSTFATELIGASFFLGLIQIGIYLRSRKRDTRGVALSLFIALFALGFFAGALRTQFVHEEQRVVCDQPCTMHGVIVGDVERKDSYQRFAVRSLDAEEDVYDIQVRSPLYPIVRVGETYAITGRVVVPATIFPHGDETSFDYASYLRTRHIGSDMFFPKMELIDGEAHTLTALLGRMKERCVIILNSFLSSPSSLLASGMLFGESSFPKEMIESFRGAGLSHIVVLSGFNIAIVVSFAFLIFRILPLAPRLVLAFIFVLMFVMMVEAEASILRAALMAFIGLLALAFGRRYVAQQALVLSMLSIVMYDPYSLLHDVSLHLSFVASAGIIYLSEPISLIATRYVHQKFIVGLFSTTLAAYVSTLPYIAHTFGTVSMYALVANMIVLPLVPVVMLSSFMTILGSFISPYVALMFGFLSSILGSVILYCARLVTSLPYAQMQTSSYAVWAITVCIFIFTIFLVRYQARKDETQITSQEGITTDVIAY